MAEVAAGAVVAEQVVSTSIQGGAVAYAVSRPTMPLKATFQQLGTTELTRSHHTLNIGAEGKAYMFGGESGPGRLCENDMHVVTLPSKEEQTQHGCIPAQGESGGEVPCPRTKHATCIQGHQLALFGGKDSEGHVVDQDSCIWIFDTQTFKWKKITTTSHASQNAGTPQSRFNHKLFAYNGHLILHGGQSSEENPLNDTWFLDLTSNTWTQLPDAPVHSESVALVDGVLYAISQLPTENFCRIHTLEIGQHVPATDPSTLLTTLAWQSVSASSSDDKDLPPRGRLGAGLVPIDTGYGRQFLVYLFGSDSPSVPSSESKNPERTVHSSLWTYQIPSKTVAPSSWTDLKPAAIKDSIRNAFGQSSGVNEWAEVEVQITDTEQLGEEGKVHPGPRAFFGVDVGADGKSVVLWGGVNAKGEKEGDGWLISF